MEGDDVFGEISAAGAAEKTEVWLLHDQLNEDVKTKLIGTKKEQTVKLDIQSLFKDLSNLAKAMRTTEEEARNLAGEYELKITRFHRVVPSEINQEFYDKIFGKDTVKSDEEFQVKLKETVQKNYNHEADHYTEHQIQERLIESTKMDIGENFYKKWILATNKDKLTEEDVNKNYDHYLKELKWSLIFNKVSEDHGIKVEHDDVLNNAKELIRSQFAAYGVEQSAVENLDSFANNYLKGKEGENYFNTYNRVKSEKVMGILKEKLQIITKNVTPADFLQKIQKT
jgi:trigger factor